MLSCGVCLFLCLCVSVCLSHSWVVSKRINISKFFHRRVAMPFYFFRAKRHSIYSDGNPPNGGVECRWGNRDSEPLSGFSACCYGCHMPGVVNRVAGGPGPPSRKLWHITGSKRWCWLWEKTTNYLWQEASTSRQRQQNSAFNCTQW